MADTANTKSLLRHMLPKIIRAIIMGVVWFIFLYVLPTLLVSFVSSALPPGAPDVFSGYEQLFTVFAFVVIFFVVASELTSGTIFQHAFNVGRAFILMIFVVLALQGGVVSLDFQGIHIVADLTVYVIMLLTIDLLLLAKSVLGAVNFLSQKAEQQLATAG